MAQISIIFRKVFETPETYLNQRVASLNQAGLYCPDQNTLKTSASQLNNYVKQLVTALDEYIPIPLSETIDFSSLDKSLSIRKDCMIVEINKLFPSNDGEHTESETVHYLTEEWHSYTKHSIVLKKNTNLSECLYIYHQIQAEPQSNGLIEQHNVNDNSQIFALVSNASPDFGAAAKKLADGLAGLLPKPLNLIGATLISAFWPSSSNATSQWQEIYNTLQTIIKNGLAQNNVTIASAKIQGFITFLDTEYKALKDTPSTSKKQLMAALTPYDTAFFLDIVNIFMFTNTDDEGIAAASLANFMIGASLHIGLNQERALIDPNASKPTESAYAKTVSNLALTYSKYAKNTAPYVKQLRLAQIGTVKNSSNTYCHGGPSAGCTTNYNFWFTDSNTNYKSADYSYNSAQKHPPNAQSDAQSARVGYYNNISSQMDTMLQSQVFDVVSSWSILLTNPIPKPTH